MMRLYAMRKIWKSIFALKLSCPAYESDNPDPFRMVLIRAFHEQIRLQYRMQMVGEGASIKESEKRIENNVFVGKIDDVFEGKGGIVAVDYVSSFFPRIYKINDVAISAGYLKHELNADASARVVSRCGVTEIPDELIADTWQMAMSEDFLKILNLSSGERLEYANPASGVCNYCANKECKFLGQDRCT
jgi:hypothetical protein